MVGRLGVFREGKWVLVHQHGGLVLSNTTGGLTHGCKQLGFNRSERPTVELQLQTPGRHRCLQPPETSSGPSAPIPSGRPLGSLGLHLELRVWTWARLPWPGSCR